MIYDYDSCQSYLKEVLRLKSSKNVAFSLRAMAQQVGISPSGLSNFLNQKKTISTDNALKIVQWLKLNEQESDYFLSLLQLETVKSQKTRTNLAKKIIDLKPVISEKEVKEVRALLDSTLVDFTATYAEKNSLNCRTLVCLKDKTNGKRVRSFCQSLFFPDRFASLSIYIIENPNGTFRAYQNQVLAGEHKLAKFIKSNRSLKVTFDKDGYPKVHGLTMFVAVTNRFGVFDLTYSKEKVTIRGFFQDHISSANSAVAAYDYHRI
ncbi:MAG: TIGR02147 family protein [Pseudobdellovibrionaceae bacterium]